MTPRPEAVVLPERAEDIIDSVLKALEFPTLLNGSEKTPKGFPESCLHGHELIVTGRAGNGPYTLNLISIISPNFMI
jgi:hypothetical protein